MNVVAASKLNSKELMWTGLRVLSGALWLLFGLNGFIGFIPMPAPAPEAGQFYGAMAATGYMFPLIKGSEVVAGALLLSGRYTNFALILLAPILVNILLLHIFLDPAGIMMGLVLSLMHVALVVHRWNDLKFVFKS